MSVISNKETDMNYLSEQFCERYKEKWDARSSLRSRPVKPISFQEQGYFFPSDKQPLLLIPEIKALGHEVKAEILLQSFYKYLNEIINLEFRLINSACDKIIYEPLIVDFPEYIKLSVYTIIIDEYFHVLTARDMMTQLDKHFPKREKYSYPVSDAMNAVQTINAKLDVKYHSIFEIIAVCIFETTLVRELVEFFKSHDVHPSIKYYVNDHMNDESRHYQFFYELLCYTWEKIPEDYRHNIGINMANFVKLYLNIESDKSFNLELLNHYLRDRPTAVKMVDKIYQGFDITPELPIVNNVIRVLAKSGILAHKSVCESFLNIGWNLMSEQECNI